MLLIEMGFDFMLTPTIEMVRSLVLDWFVPFIGGGLTAALALFIGWGLTRLARL